MISATGVAASTTDKKFENVLLVDQVGYEQAKQSDKAVRVRVASDKVLGDISVALKGFTEKHSGKTGLFLLLPLAGCGGGGTSSNVITGRAVDGYIVGGTVTRLNGEETAALTTSSVEGSEGTFTLSDLGGSGPYQISGGQDVGIAGNPSFAGNLIAPADFTVATPLSTLISALIDPNLDGDTSDGTTVAAAETSVKTALGLTGVTDLSDYDPVALAAAGDATALNVLKQGQYVATLLVQSSGGDLANFGLIAGQLAKQMQTIAVQIGDGTLAANYVYDLTDATTIDDFLSSAAAVLPSGVVDTSVTATIVSINAIIAAAEDLDSLSTGLAAVVNESGVALKGPLHKATVFADYNGDGELTAGEAYTTTASDGSYALNATVVYKDEFKTVDGSVVAGSDGLHDDTGEAIDTTGFDTLDYSIVVQMGADTIDYSTGESYANAGVSLKAAPGSGVITPMTTLHEHSEEHATDFAVEELAAALGVPDSVDILTFNTHAKGVDEELAHQIESIQQHLMTTTMLVQAAITGSGTAPVDALNFVKATGGQVYAGVTITGDTDVISADNQTVSVSIWSPSVGETVRLKLTDPSDSSFVEVDATTTVASGWEVLTYDFSSATGLDHAKTYSTVDLFPSFNAVSADQQYYVQSITSGEVGYNYGNVMQVSKGTSTETWGGSVVARTTSGEFISEGNDTVTMRIYSPAAGDTMTLKIENKDNTADFVEANATTTVAGGWETLTFDLSAADHALTYNQAILFPDNGTANSNKDWYVDSITFASNVVTFDGDDALDTPGEAFGGGYSAIVPAFEVDGLASVRPSAHSGAAATAGSIGQFDYGKLLLNPPPAFTSDATVSLSEDATTGTLLTLAATDTETVTYSISSGADIDGDGTDDVTVDSSTGVVSYTLSGDGFDYETKTSYSLTFSASDGTTATSQVFTLNVTNVDEEPTLAVVLGAGSTAGTAQTLAEDAAAADTTVFTATATDPESATPTYTLTGTDAADFSISSSGAVTLNTAGDYETKTSYALTINASDGTNSVSQAVTLALTNANEAPDISVTVDGTAASAATVAEGTATSTTIFTVDDGDPDAGDSITYSLGAHSDNTDDSASFAIDQSTGKITFVSAPDYETKTSYKLAVTASDGSLSDSQDLTVAVTDVAGDTPLTFDVKTATTSAIEIDVILNAAYVSGQTPSTIEGFQFDIKPDDDWGAIDDYFGLEYSFAVSSDYEAFFAVTGNANVDANLVSGTGLNAAAPASASDSATIAYAKILNSNGMSQKEVTEPGAVLSEDFVLGTITMGGASAGSYDFTVDNVVLDFDDPLTDNTSVTFTVDIA